MKKVDRNPGEIKTSKTGLHIRNDSGPLLDENFIGLQIKNFFMEFVSSNLCKSKHYK